MKQINYILGIFIALLALASCDTYSDDFDIDYTAIHPLGGMYKVHITDEAGTVIDNTQYCYLANTTDNSTTECWIRIGDYNAKITNAWAINGKINCNVPELTFSGSNVENLAGNVVSSTETFSVSDGQMKLQGATAPSGTVADQISFTFTNSRFPGKTYKVEGYRYTGWGED